MNPVSLFLATVTLALLPFTAHAESAIKDHDRIVFIGDSITGQGALGGANAWIARIGEGLQLTRPDAKPTLIGLGGSGATVGAWQNFEKRSLTEAVILDVKDIEVGKTLDAGADIAVFMLGMNDVLAPAIDGEPAGYDQWIARYAELIESIRARCHPRVIAVATVTPCTADPASPKNLAIAELNQRLTTLAREKKFLLLPTSTASYEIQRLGRETQSYFHITGDFVHPNHAGHLAIAMGMLRGLGEVSAATLLQEKHTALYRSAADTLPTLSYTLTHHPASPDDAIHQFLVEYQWSATQANDLPKVTATAPAGWKVKPASRQSAKGSFILTGPLDHLVNPITLTATSGDITRQETINIPAGWRIASGRGKSAGWIQNSTYSPENDIQPIDTTLASGEGFGAPVAFPASEQPAPWRRHLATRDYTGLDSPGSIDFAAVTFYRHGHQAHGARWIHSDKARPIILDLSSRTFAGINGLNLWLNGQSAFAGKFEKKTLPATLRKGWNLLYFRSNFISWQWQFSIDVKATEGDDLSDLRYATTPQ